MDFFILENLNYITVVRDSGAPEPPQDAERGVMFTEEYVIAEGSGLGDTGYYTKTRRLPDKPMMYGAWRSVVGRAMLGYSPFPGGVGNSIYGWVPTRGSSMDRQVLMSDGFYSSGVEALRFKATIPPTGDDSSIEIRTSIRVPDCGKLRDTASDRPVAGTWENPDGGVSGYAEVSRPDAEVEGPECWAGNNYCGDGPSGNNDNGYATTNGLLTEGEPCGGGNVYGDWSSEWTGTVVNGECVNDGLDVSVTLDRGECPKSGLPLLPTDVDYDPDDMRLEVEYTELSDLLKEAGWTVVPSIDGLVCDWMKEEAIRFMIVELEKISVDDELYSSPSYSIGPWDFGMALGGGAGDGAQWTLAAIQFGHGDWGASILNVLKSVPSFGEALNAALGSVGVTAWVSGSLDYVRQDDKKRIIRAVLKSLKYHSLLPVPTAVISILAMVGIQIGRKEWDQAFLTLLRFSKAGKAGQTEGWRAKIQAWSIVKAKLDAQISAAQTAGGLTFRA